MLTGDININYHTIGTWKAVNIGGNQVQDELQSYKVTVEYTNKGGYHQIAEFYLRHPYDEKFGALTLAAKVLENAPNFLRGAAYSER